MPDRRQPEPPAQDPPDPPGADAAPDTDGTGRPYSGLNDDGTQRPYSGLNDPPDNDDD